MLQRTTGANQNPDEDNLTIRAAVIGLGWMGVNHARIYSEIPNADLVAVADVSRNAANDIATKYDCRPYESIDDMLQNERLDVASISVPTPQHFDVASQFIEAGVNVLVEKPIALETTEAQAMIDAAKSKGVTLGVGHIERFNPVIVGLKTVLESGEIGTILQVSIRRIGPHPDRDRGTGVFLDLATHDVDIIRYLTDSEVSSVASLSKSIGVSKYEDLGMGLLGMSDGSLATITENWVSPTKIREITVTGDRGMLVADTITQDLFQFDNDYTISDWASIQNFRGMSEGRMIRHRLTKGEPLRLEIEAFVDAVSNGTTFGVEGEDGLKALEIALQLRDGPINGDSV